MSYFPILLRAEQKPLGHPVSVERSSTDPNFRRIFDDEE
jgi:hypothetical protein